MRWHAYDNNRYDVVLNNKTQNKIHPLHCHAMGMKYFFVRYARVARVESIPPLIFFFLSFSLSPFPSSPPKHFLVTCQLVLVWGRDENG